MCRKMLRLFNLRAFEAKVRDDVRKKLIAELFAYHRTAYSNERKAYYERADRAINMPHDFYSSISDGMSSHKTRVPFKGDNTYDYNPSLPLHIQAEFAHGRALHIYRTFHNVTCGGNLATHCWLLSLQREYKKNMKETGGRRGLPDTIYHQVDGGCENTARAALAACELLVARRLTKKVVLSRLIVGHTHEDIDAIFGVIWNKLMTENALSPQKYRDILVESCKNKAPEVRVQDIWVVPDYKSYFKPFISSDLKRYAKGKWSQLQITFETATPHTVTASTGVKITHRAFSCDNVKLLRRLPHHAPRIQDPLHDPLLQAENEILQDIKAMGFPGVIWDDESVHEGTDFTGLIDVGSVERSYRRHGTHDDDDINPALSLGYTPVNFIVRSYPKPEDKPTVILKEIPTGNLSPEPFEKDSYSLIQSVFRMVTKKVVLVILVYYPNGLSLLRVHQSLMMSMNTLLDSQRNFVFLFVKSCLDWAMRTSLEKISLNIRKRLTPTHRKYSQMEASLKKPGWQNLA